MKAMIPAMVAELHRSSAVTVQILSAKTAVSRLLKKHIHIVFVQAVEVTLTVIQAHIIQHPVLQRRNPLPLMQR
jgi:hypothetical protein